MLQFFGDTTSKVFAVESSTPLTPKSIDKLYWLFGKAPALEMESIEGKFVGPRATMITPWSTNAVEITQNMGIEGITRIEEYFSASVVDLIDPMLVVEFQRLDQTLFHVDILPKK